MIKDKTRKWNGGRRATTSARTTTDTAWQTETLIGRRITSADVAQIAKSVHIAAQTVLDKG
jgi:hypothetical protein